MNRLSRFEQLMEQLVETPFARLFKSRLHPADLAKQLARAMERGATADEDGKIIAPNHYTVQVNPADMAELQRGADISTEIAAVERYLTALIHEMGSHTVSPVQVDIHASADTARGEMSISVEKIAAADTLSGDTKRFQPAFPPANHWQLLLPERTIRLGMPIVRIGRDETNDIVLKHPTVSRYHGLLRWLNGVYFVENLSQSQPLGVNFKPVTTRTPLKAGDTLQLGQVTLSIEIQS